MIKLLMSWDIKSGRENDYFEFIVREFAPIIMKMGLRPTESWYTVYGEGPQILTGAVTDDLDAMMNILRSEEWKRLHQKLLTYVTDYRHKVVRATSTFQLL